jgi:hypothetical protein
VSQPQETKYGHLCTRADEEPEADEEEADHRDARVDYQRVTVYDHEPERIMEYMVYVGHGDHDWCPIATHADRAHQVSGSNQFDPHGSVEWEELPAHVQERVAEVVAGVEGAAELAPTVNGGEEPR